MKKLIARRIAASVALPRAPAHRHPTPSSWATWISPRRCARAFTCGTGSSQPTRLSRTNTPTPAICFGLNFAEKRGALDLDAEIAVPFLYDLPTHRDRSGAAGRARPRVELLQRERQPAVRRHGVRETALRPLSFRLEGRAERAGRALRIQRRHGTRAEERHARDTQARPDQPAVDRHVRVLRCGPQLRWRALFVVGADDRLHVRRARLPRAVCFRRMAGDGIASASRMRRSRRNGATAITRPTRASSPSIMTTSATS